MVIAVVSTASKKWIQQCLDLDVPRKRKGPIKLSKLSKFLKENDTELLSAKDASYDFLLQKMGKELADLMIESAVGGLDENQQPKRWMLKYMAFAAIILKYRSKFGMECNRVISIGDGEEEEFAVKKYATEQKMECFHFGFLRHPTIEQLQTQWVWMEQNFHKLMCTETKGNEPDDQYVTVHHMSSVDGFESNNNRCFSGSDKQLPAIGKYIDLWLKTLPDDNATSEMESVCAAIRSKAVVMEGVQEQQLKRMIHYLATHNEMFLKTWISAYRR